MVETNFFRSKIASLVAVFKDTTMQIVISLLTYLIAVMYSSRII